MFLNNLIFFILISILGLTSKEAQRIPEPAKNFKVELIDKAGVIIEGEYFSIEGNTYIKCKMGETQFFIPFGEIKVIEFENVLGDEVSASILLKDGTKLDVRIFKDLKCYGKTKFGKFSVKISNIQKLTFKTPLKKKKLK